MTRVFLACLAVLPLLSGCRHAHTTFAYQSPYDEPLLSPGIKFLALPSAVQNSIRAQAGAAEIEDIGRYDVHGGTFYKVWFRRSGSFPPLYIAPDGSILNSDLTVSIAAPVETHEELAGQKPGTLSLADLPQQAVKAIQAQAKSLEIRRIEEGLVGSKRVYDVYFKNSPGLPMIRVDQDGHILEGTSGINAR